VEEAIELLHLHQIHSISHFVGGQKYYNQIASGAFTHQATVCKAAAKALTLAAAAP
jgi:hypothetical protein